jgi:hypothetical protein
MASFNTILSDIGTAFKKFFGVAVTVATDAEPLVDTLFPGFATLYNGAVAEAAKAEALAAAAGAQSGTGAQKLALVVQSLTPSILAYAEVQGLPKPTADQITAYTNAVVATLNAFSAKTTTPAA